MDCSIRQRAHIFLKSHIFVLNKFLTDIIWLGVRFVKFFCLTENFDFTIPTASPLVKTSPKTTLITTCEDTIVKGTLTSDAGLPALQNIRVL